MDPNIQAERQYPTPFAASPLFPLLLVSLAVQRQAPQTKTDFREEYDYIVVGAGAAGSVVANRLSELPFTVLLLEAGKSAPRVSDVPGVARSFIGSDLDWNYKTTPQRFTGEGLVNRQLAWPSGKALGGTTIINAMLNFRGNRLDYDHWAEQGAEGWNYASVLPYFKKLEDNLEYADDSEYHGTSGPVSIQMPRYDTELKSAVREAAEDLGYSFGDPNGANQKGFANFQATNRVGQRCSTAKAYLVPAETRPNLDIVSNAFVKKVLIQDSTAFGVQLDFKGSEREVRAKKEVILSAGTVNTAQLLLLSGIGPKEHLDELQIPVINDLPVGKNFQDHIAPLMVYQLGDQIPPILQKLGDDRNIQEYIDSRTGPLASVEGVTSISILTNNRTDTDPNVLPDIETYFMEGANLVAQTQINMKPEVYNQVLAPYENNSTLWCVPQNLHPKSRGFVKLASTDPYEPPIIEPNYFQEPGDIDALVGGMKFCRVIVEHPALQAIGARKYDTLYPGCEQLADDEEKYYECQLRSVIVTLSHQVGTARMGNLNDATTVVDPQLRVKGIGGLRVVDASVMPTVPTGNTMIPTIMVAEKASDMIKSGQ